MQGGVWYLVADSGGEPRLFRVSRVAAAVADQAPVRCRDGVELASLWASLRRQVEHRPTPLEAVVRVRREWLDMFGRICAAHLTGPLGPHGPLKHPKPLEPLGSMPAAAGGWVQVRLRFAAVQAARTLLSFGANVEVISPPEVRADLAAAADVVARYSNLRLGYDVRVSVSVQESLLDVAEEPVLGALGGAVRRVPLSRGAWVDLRPGWLAGSGAVFGALAGAVPWRAERRHMYDQVVDVPRLLCFYGEGEPLPHPMLATALGALNARYGAELGEPFRTAGLCLYRDGRDSVAWHGDRIGRGAREDTMVAILSLGAPRAFLLRPRDGGASLRFEAGHGDLLVMGGSCQRTWEHAVPKTARAVGPRISVQFRPRGVR